MRSTETEICRERGSIAPGKFLRVRKVFALKTLWSIISGTCLENHWSFCQVYGLSGKFPDCLERFWIVWKVSILSENLLYFLDSIEGLDTFQIFWQVTKLTRKFSDYLESFHIVWKENFPGRLESFQFVCKLYIFSKRNSRWPHNKNNN